MDGYRDLWWEARENTRRMGAWQRWQNVFQSKMVSFPFGPTRAALVTRTFGTEQNAIVVDLNKYRPGRNLQAFIDAGVDAFILRMGGPTQWVEGDYRYQEDATWRAYFDQLVKLGRQKSIVGYWIHNPFEDWHLQGIISNVQLNLINQWTSGGYMPQAFVCDHEVATMYRGITPITATAVNLVGSLDSTTDQVYKQWRKMVGIYSGRWFLDANAKAEHITYFDNVNKPVSLGGAGKQRGIWLAWLPVIYSREYTNFQTALNEEVVPSGTQLANYLNIGSYSTADLWQFSFTLKLPGDITGVDCSVSVASKADYYAQFGLSDGTVTPPPPPPPTGDFATRADVAAVQTQLDSVKTTILTLQSQANATDSKIGGLATKADVSAMQTQIGQLFTKLDTINGRITNAGKTLAG